MPEHKPLYLYSLKEAAEWDEKDEWRESYLENCDCARAIERVIDEHYDGQRLNPCAKEVIDRYGFDRVNFVLAATVRQGISDGRYSEDNKNWARRFSVMDKENAWQYNVRRTPDLLIFLLPTQDDYGIGSDYLTAAIAKMKAAVRSTIPTG